MSLLGDLFSKAKKFYITTVYCINCGVTTELRVPKGQTADAYIQSAQAICPFCGCSTLKRLTRASKSQIPEVRNPIKLQPIQQSHSNSHQQVQDNKQYQTQSGTSLKLNPQQPKRINFWTGEEQ